MIPDLHEFLARLKSLFRKRRMNDDMAEELEFHQTLLREKLLRQGVPQSQIDAALRRTFGNPSRWNERLRELIGLAAAILASRALPSFLYATPPRPPGILSAPLY